MSENDNSGNLVTIRVWGDFACFTRPEMKVERVSYPLPTPSAARGILEAIYWEPQMHYVVDSIRVIKKGRWISFRRNEVKKVISIKDAQQWMAGAESVSFIEAGGGAKHADQRNMLALADVEYLLTAEVRTTSLHDHSRYTADKHLREIRDRAQKGKCHFRPAFGCREFAVDFDHEPDAQATHERRVREVHGIDATPATLWHNEDLGLMLYDVFDHEQRAEGFRWLTEAELAAAIESEPNRRGTRKQRPTMPRHEGREIRPCAYFFRASVKDARMDCHFDRVQLVRHAKEETERCS